MNLIYFHLKEVKVTVLDNVYILAKCFELILAQDEDDDEEDNAEKRKSIKRCMRCN